MKDLFKDHTGKTSIKRVFGSIGFVSGMVLAFMKYELSTITLVLTVSSALLGLETMFFSVFGGKKNGKTDR